MDWRWKVVKADRLNLGDLQSRIVEQEENVSLKHLVFWDLPSTVAKLEREVSYQRYRLQERSLSKRLEHTRTGFTIIEIDQCEK